MEREVIKNLPTQEDRAIARIKSILAYIRDRDPTKGELRSQEIFDWSLFHQGTREKTVASYLRSLKGMGLISIEGDLITYIKR